MNDNDSRLSLKDLRDTAPKPSPGENAPARAVWRDAELIQSEERYRRLVELSPDMILLHSQGRYVYANPAAVRILGASRPEELVGKSVLDRIHPEFREKVIQRVQRLEQGKEIPPSEEKFIRLDGGEIDVEVAAAPLFFQDQPMVLVVGRDITGRKRVEEALRRSEEKYRTLVDHATDVIVIIQDEKVKFYNPKTLSLSGYSPEELSRIPFIDLIHPEDRDGVLDRYQRRIRGEDVPSRQTLRLVNKAGEELWGQINSVPIAWEGRPATLNFVRDITREKKLEVQFQHAQKMEAVGTLAGGIAHDFNNLLMGIQGHVSLMLFNLDPGSPNYESLKRIEEQVRLGANLAGQLLAFARRGKYEVKISDVNKIVQHTSALFERTRKEVRVHRKYQEGIWAVEVDRGQIEQVIMNLCVNAWQAMPDGGDLFLETMNVTLGPDYIRPFFVEPGNYVRISVRDTGVGMDKKTQQRLFEPFFTTKEMGRGTGLGLASVYGIIKNHGGFINVYSEKGHGTNFTIYLPGLDEKIAEERKASGEPLSGKETILLVDDEHTIVEVMEKALTLTGYRVLVARGGEEAVELYRQNRERIDVVVLDMIMPGMNGGKVFDLLRETNPGVKVILSSGYSIDGDASQIMARGCNGFIQKPFGINELSKKIGEVMNRSGEREDPR